MSILRAHLAPQDRTLEVERRTHAILTVVVAVRLRFLIWVSLMLNLDCAPQCATCSSSNACMTCVENYFYTKAYALCSECPSGKYSEGGTVATCKGNIHELVNYANKHTLDCVAPCLTCTSASKCSSCLPNHYYNSVTSSCTACTGDFVSPGGTVTACSYKSKISLDTLFQSHNPCYGLCVFMSYTQFIR